jgi:hypothetical protein
MFVKPAGVYDQLLLQGLYQIIMVTYALVTHRYASPVS